MGMGLYDAAFATLTRIYGADARQPITGITLIAGFASTVGWPVTAYLDARFGWRVACLVWAATHLVLALPLNFTLPRVTRLTVPQAAQDRPSAALNEAAAAQATRQRWAMIAVAYVFAATGFVSTGISAVLPTLLVQIGTTPTAAIFAGTLVGPAQVAARIVEAGWLSRYHPLISAQLATLSNPLGVLTLVFGGPVLAPAFAVLYGAGNGILTIARGTLPLALFGPERYPILMGRLAMPILISMALSPLVGAVALQWGGANLTLGYLAGVAATNVLLVAALWFLSSGIRKSTI